LRREFLPSCKAPDIELKELKDYLSGDRKSHISWVTRVKEFEVTQGPAKIEEICGGSSG
jgi:hypothetical protein